MQIIFILYKMMIISIRILFWPWVLVMWGWLRDQWTISTSTKWGLMLTTGESGLLCFWSLRLESFVDYLGFWDALWHVVVGPGGHHCHILLSASLKESETVVTVLLQLKECQIPCLCLWWFMFCNEILQGVRTTLVYHVTWLVNSACHVWGKQAWNTGDLSRNNWWVALLAFGEGWHNNHHAFGYSARHGLEWWQLDMTWYVIRLLQAVGLATDVKLPSEVQRQRMALEAANWVWFDLSWWTEYTLFE